MSLETGTRFGTYEIQGLLGQGGMGEVYRARDTSLDRDVAIKVLPDKLADDPSALNRFEREVKAVAALAHPNIVAIYDFGIEAGRAYAAMELLEGETLRERLSQGALAPRKAAEISRQVARALGAAHDHGIAHRDLKPENIFISPEGRAKVLDFGLAAAFEDAERVQQDTTTCVSLTIPGTVMGTVGYMSPEQVRGEMADHRSDIFSFGCVLHEMLTGARAFQRDTSAETMTAILREEPSEVEMTTGPSSPALARVVRRCVEKSPDERFQSARDLAFAIDDSATSLDDPHVAATAAAPSRARVGWPAVGLAALLGLVAGFAIAVVLRGPGDAEPPRVRTLTVSGRDREPTISPDGRIVAFTSTRDGTPRIWIKQLSGGGEEPLTAGPDGSPSFSPDGSTLLFQRDDGVVLSVYRQALVGGQARKVVENAFQPSWSPGGQQIAFLRVSSVGGNGTDSVGIYDIRTGSERIVAEFDSGLQGTAWSPDGKTIAVVEAFATGSSPDYRLLLIDVGSGEIERRTVGDGRPLSFPVWTAEGELIFAVAGSLLGDQGDSASRFVRYSPASGTLRTLFWTEHLFPMSGLRVEFTQVDVVDAGTLMYDQLQTRQNLREVLVGRRGLRRVLTHGEGLNRQPIYTPDGRQVVFSSNRSGNLDLWALDLETGVHRQLTDDAAQDWDPALTPDGEEIVWSSSRSGHLEIWIARADGSNPRQLTQDGLDAENPTVTRDGEWIVYSTANPEKQGMWKIRRDGSEATQLISASMLFAETSPDGRHAAYVSLDLENLRNEIHVVNVASGERVPFQIDVQTPLRAGNIILGRPRWLPDGSAIAFVGMDEQNRTGVYAQDFVPGTDTSATRRILAGFSSDVTESFGISPDGLRITLALQEETARLMLAESVSGVSAPE